MRRVGLMSRPSAAQGRHIIFQDTVHTLRVLMSPLQMNFFIQVSN